MILQDYGPYWQLSADITIELFAEHLTRSGILSANKFYFKKWVPNRVRFWTKKADIYDVVLSLLPRAYLSHYTALFLHGLRDKSPKTIFVSSEQSPKSQNIDTSELEQDDVDTAFAKQQRHSNAICVFQGKEITALNGMFTNQAGIINLEGKAVTSIERTLIDITVRPSYAGGIPAVFRAYVALQEKVDVSAMIAMLDHIGYVYPYFQSIGFYLEMAGYDTAEVEKLKQREMFIDFYLGHAMEEMEYSAEWRLYLSASLKTGPIKDRVLVVFQALGFSNILSTSPRYTAGTALRLSCLRGFVDKASALSSTVALLFSFSCSA